MNRITDLQTGERPGCNATGTMSGRGVLYVCTGDCPGSGEGGIGTEAGDILARRADALRMPVGSLEETREGPWASPTVEL